MLNFADKFEELPGVNENENSGPARANLREGDNDIYAYSTLTKVSEESDTPTIDKGEVHIKIGEAREQSAEERMAGQDGPRADEPMVELLILNNVDFSDKEFHNFLDDPEIDSYNVRKYDSGDKNDGEWYSFNSVEHFCELLNKHINDVQRPKSFKPYEAQKQAMKKMFNAWDYGYDEFLLAAKMRFGKNFTIMTHIRDWHEENKLTGEQTRVFFTSYMPNVFDSLEKDLDNHIFFDNFELIRLKESVKYKNQLPEPESDADVVVYVGSAQLVLTNTDDGNPYKVLENEHFDFVIADEVHYGGNTWNFNQNIIDANYFSYDKLIWMTGTPFKFARVRSFSERNSFYFTYLEEQKLKNADRETWADDMPTFKFHMVDISERAKGFQEHFEEKERFRLDKLFATDEDGNLKHRPSVKKFFEQIAHGEGRTEYSPYRMCSHSEHSMWMLPRNVAAVKAAKDVLNEMPEYDGYEVLVAAGEGTDNDGNPVLGSGDIERLENKINRDNLADKTITLTCGRFKEGTTVEDWHMILMMNDGKSVEDYFQTAFRAGTPLDTKEFAHVFDFNPERTISVMFEGTEGMRQAEGREGHTEVIRELLNCAHIIDHRENGFNEVDADSIMQTFLDTADQSERVSALGNIPADQVEESMADAVADLDEGAREIAESPNENDTDGGKKEDVNYQNNGSDGDSEDDDESIESIRRGIQTALQNLVAYLLVSEKDEESVNEVLETANEELFERHVGISIEAFEEIVPALDTERIDLQIQEFTYYQKQYDEPSYN